MTAQSIGLAAAFLTSVAAVPQVVRTWRTKRADDLSVWQPALLSAGLTLWLGYGILLGDLPLIAANIFTLACNLTLLIMKISFSYLAKGKTGCYVQGKTATEES